MNLGSQRSARSLLWFDPNIDDETDDYAAEISAVLDVPIEEAHTLITTVLGTYHEGDGSIPVGLPRHVVRAVIHITQPYRIPHMTDRMDQLIASLRADPPAKTVLDYGGGGGKDSIIFSKLGYDVTYTDLFDEMTPLTEARFKLRGLEIDMRDVVELGNRRFDAVNCLDVVEHVYDVEHVVADLIARLNPGGHLFCYPAFFNTWDGEHIEKNCGYAPYFEAMLQGVGMIPMGDSAGQSISYRLARLGGLNMHLMPVLHYKKPGKLGGVIQSAATVDEERTEVKHDLYELSKKHSIRRAGLSAGLLPLAGLGAVVLSRTAKAEAGRLAMGTTYGHLADNLAIFRLSRHRLRSGSGKNDTLH